MPEILKKINFPVPASSITLLSSSAKMSRLRIISFPEAESFTGRAEVNATMENFPSV